MTHHTHEHHKPHHDHHHATIAHELEHIKHAAEHALEHLSKGDHKVAKDIIEHLITSANALENHAAHLS